MSQRGYDSRDRNDRGPNTSSSRGTSRGGDRDTERGEPRYPPASAASGRSGGSSAGGRGGPPERGQPRGNGGYGDRDRERERERGGGGRGATREREQRSEPGMTSNTGRDRLAEMRTGAGSSASSYDNAGNYNSRDRLQRSPSANSTGNRGGAARGPPNGGGGSGAFYDQIERIQTELDRIAKRELPDLIQLQQRIISNTQPGEVQRLTNQMNQIQDGISAQLQLQRKTVRTLSTEAANMPAGAESHSRKGQVGTVAKKIMNVADEFQSAQRSFKNKYKQRMEREIRIARPDATPQEIARALDSQSGSAFSQQLLSSRNEKSRRALEEVQDRHTELQKIERSLTELFDLFQEMQALIETQQEMINNVEANVENAVVYVEEGSKELTKAVQYRKQTRKKQWWILYLILAIVLIVGIVVYFQVIRPLMAVTGGGGGGSSNSGPSAPPASVPSASVPVVSSSSSSSSLSSVLPATLSSTASTRSR
ncbi:Plasma membrane t-SNARE, secretory vesicle fusion [Chytriomyces hyalinus]|nr:Plasma membrane t-SNARE, secretory vesicle fusion [Chytriomyces hyalinus]